MSTQPADIPTQKTVKRGRWAAFNDGLTTTLLVIVEVVGFFAQIALVFFGIEYINGDDKQIADDIDLLLLWCAVGTVYLAGAAMWISLSLRIRSDDPSALRKIIGSALVRWVSLIVTFSSSLVGLTAAVELILVRDDPSHPKLYELTAVWAMLVAWALFQWGYARTYHAHFYRAKGVAPLVFPGTEAPRLSDFAYFAFSNGTSFATNDVTVRTSRMRWMVVWHTTYSFFFNALIIVLTMNTILGGFDSR